MPTRPCLDLFKRHRSQYVAPRQPRLIQIEPAQYLAMVGGDCPCCAEAGAQERALYVVALALRAVATAKHQRDFILGKLECQLSKALMRVPSFVTHEDLTHAVAMLQARGLEGGLVNWVNCAQLEQMGEGLCVQMLHLGPNDSEAQAKTVATLLNFAQTHGLERAGPSHLVYLVSSRHVPPEHLRTLLRVPVHTVNRAQGASG